MRTRTRVTIQTILALAATAAIGLATISPAAAHNDRERAERLRSQYSTGSYVPLVTSPNVRLAATFPDTAGISGCFMPSAPVFVMSSLDSVSVYDVSDPVQPRLAGVLDNVMFENEAMSCGERKDPATGAVTRFVLIGNDLVSSSSDDIEHTQSSVGGREVVVVDVTDPARPSIRGRGDTTTSTHTVTCVIETTCRYAYSAGSNGRVSIIDLADLSAPREVGTFQSGAVGWGGHKWNFDSAGYGTHTGAGGSFLFDVRSPLAPRLVARTGPEYNSLQDTSPTAPDSWNNFIHHNSFRPQAKSFRPNAPASFSNGNILLVTEEDYEQTLCDKAGSFQTWHVKTLGTQLADGSWQPGEIVPLHKVELRDLGAFKPPADTFCSAHWFDYHESGVVAIGFYGGGTQFLKVGDGGVIKPHGYAQWGASEVWDSYWVPVYNKKDVATGRSTNIAYSVDLVRGLDVYVVDLPSAASSDPLTLTSASSGVDPSRPQDAGLMVLAVITVLGATVLRRRTASLRREGSS